MRLEGVTVETDPVDLAAITLRLSLFEEAVVVTATRIEELLQQVPMSVSAVTGADLERRAIGNLTELARWTPGLTVVDQGARGSNVIIARGLNTDSLNGSEFTGNNYNNGVATYLGDIPLAVDLRLNDIERVEVLLGPQGTRYGAGTLAGAVRYLPRRPDTEQRTFEVRGDLFALAHGGAAGTDAGLTFNLPLVSRKLALRGSIDRYSDPGFIDYDYLLRTPGVSESEPDLNDPEAVAENLRREADANTEETISARLSLLWEATPNLSALFAYHLQDQQVGARQINHARAFDTGRHVSAHRFLEPNDRKNQLWSLELTWAPGGAELTTAVGYSRFGEQGQRDQTDLLIQAFGIAGLLPGDFPSLAEARAIDPGISVTDLTPQFRSFATFTREDEREERFNWETRLVSTGEGPWRWVGGVFFNNYEVGMRRSWRDGRLQRQRHAVPRGLEGHSGGGAHTVQRPADHAERRRGREPRRRVRGGGRRDQGVAPPRIVVLHGCGAEPGLARPAGWWRGRLQGRPLSGAPRHQGSLLASHAMLLGDETVLQLLYGYTYVGDVLTRIGLRAGGETLPAYHLHNLSASLSKNAWTLTLYADNLFDEYAVTGVRQTPGLIGRTEEGFRSRRYFANVLAPRRVGVRIRYTFQ